MAPQGNRRTAWLQVCELENPVGLLCFTNNQQVARWQRQNTVQWCKNEVTFPLLNRKLHSSCKIHIIYFMSSWKCHRAKEILWPFRHTIVTAEEWVCLVTVLSRENHICMSSRENICCPAHTAVVCLMLWKLILVGDVGMDMARATRTRRAWLSCQRCQRFLTAERTWNMEGK